MLQSPLRWISRVCGLLPLLFAPILDLVADYVPSDRRRSLDCVTTAKPRAVSTLEKMLLAFWELVLERPEVEIFAEVKGLRYVLELVQGLYLYVFQV